jgi:membrane-associated phospholipid phosphatase
VTDVQHTIRPGKGTRPDAATDLPRASELPAARRRAPRRFVVVAVLAALAVLVGAIGPSAYDALVGSSPKQRIAAEPPPSLFPDAVVAPLGARVDAQGTRAHRLMAGWWGTDGTRRNDAGFIAWAERTLPGPPAAAARAAELRAVQKLAPTRTAGGVAAAGWLEKFGKKDIWKLYAHDQAEVVRSSIGDARKSDLKAMLSMSKKIADALGARYQQSAPYVLDPSLRPDHTVTKGQVCPCSYPSRHAAASAASRTYLSGFARHMDAEYRWMQDEVDYSRVYMAGHVPSDITGGTLLGDMIGEYFLVTRGHRQPR